MPRDPLDRYYTDDRLADRCIEWLLSRYPEPVVVLEPCSGGGAFGRAAMRAMDGLTVRGCDIDPDAAPGYDCEQVAVSDWRPDPDRWWPTWIVTNPHYDDVYATIATMRRLQRDTKASVLALLLRSTTIDRLLNADDPPHMIAVSPQRPRWGGPGGAALTSGDTCGSVLCVWGLGPGDQRDDEPVASAFGLGYWRPRGRE